MIEKIKLFFTLPKILLGLSENMLKLEKLNSEQIKSLADIGAKHTDEMHKIEESIKIRIQDIEQLYPALRDFVRGENSKLEKILTEIKETKDKILRVNSKVDEIERKIK